MALNEQPTKIDTDVARALAQSLTSKVDEIDPLLAKIDEIRSTFHTETSAGTAGNRSPYYTPLDASLNKSLRKLEHALNQAKRNLLNDAVDISGLATGLEDVSTAAAHKLAAIPITLESTTPAK